MCRAWHAHTQRKSFLRLALQLTRAQLNHATLVAFLTAWNSTSSRRHDNRVAVQQALARRTNKTLRGMLTSWRRFAQERATQEARVCTFVNSRRNKALYAAFATWREWAEQKAAVRAKLHEASARLRHRQLETACSAWHEWARYSVQGKAHMQVDCDPCLQFTLLSLIALSFFSSRASYSHAGAILQDPTNVCNKLVCQYMQMLLMDSRLQAWHLDILLSTGICMDFNTADLQI